MNTSPIFKVQMCVALDFYYMLTQISTRWHGLPPTCVLCTKSTAHKSEFLKDWVSELKSSRGFLLIWTGL